MKKIISNCKLIWNTDKKSWSIFLATMISCVLYIIGMSIFSRCWMLNFLIFIPVIFIVRPYLYYVKLIEDIADLQKRRDKL